MTVPPLTGAQLFPHSNPAVVISRHLNRTPPNLGDCRPDCAGLDDALQVALAKNPADRYASCSAFTQALTAASPGQAGASANATTQAAGQPRAPAPTLGGRPKPTAARSRLALGGFAATILLIGVIGFLWRPWQHTRSGTTVISSSNAPSTSTPSATAAAPTPAPTSAAPQPSPPPGAVAAPPEGYFDDVRRTFSDWNHGQGMGNAPGTNRVLTEVFGWVCQHQGTDPNVVNEQIQMQESWFNHPSLELYEANRLRSIAMSYCPTSSTPGSVTTTVTAPVVTPPARTVAPSSDPISCVEGATRYSQDSGITYTCRNGTWREGPPGYPN